MNNDGTHREKPYDNVEDFAELACVGADLAVDGDLAEELPRHV
jgi:hypothetical protein